MSQKVSRTLLMVEAIIIALPVSLLAILATVIYVNDTRRVIGLNPHDILAILSILSLIAIFSGWRLFVAYFYGGAAALRQQHFGWWIAIIWGTLILFASLTSALLPPSAEYSILWWLRSDFNTFVFATPIIIPTSHLAYERFLRKQIEQ